MNIFRFIADMLHLSAILILLYRIKKSRNCIGKSNVPRIERDHLLISIDCYNLISMNPDLINLLYCD